ncbi:hypothetical protein OG2516_04426 [Oceanicola granulosus HTCC2516]|uniref:Uncharacterized protein n=1 Tax=Oceanicola granulosus (strain ATCC BAA-861 / DSM 15982 / KCTC 12143 / HTCC2516) TaxID=314256 RepID=Q2CD21_OCEGH|nr:hypothetical protein [Oceanicola granulosus]EAR50555.1 hypothetical protein OG2516_04426 [Oceanicola granulosus HTCC2516]
MEWRDVQQHWAAHVPRVMTRWPEITEEEALDVDGDRAALTRLVAERQQLGQNAADGEVSDWLMGLEPADAIMDETRDDERISASQADISPGEDVYSDDREFGDDTKPEPPIGRTG